MHCCTFISICSNSSRQIWIFYLLYGNTGTGLNAFKDFEIFEFSVRESRISMARSFNLCRTRQWFWCSSLYSCQRHCVKHYPILFKVPRISIRKEAGNWHIKYFTVLLRTTVNSDDEIPLNKKAAILTSFNDNASDFTWITVIRIRVDIRCMTRPRYAQDINF